MRLPVVKILWGMFAFPLMYPGEFFRATAWPLLGVIALTLVWASGSVIANSLANWVLVVANYGLFAWLAVRIHRTVLIHPDERAGTGPAQLLPLAYRYLAALVTGSALKLVFFVAALAVFSLSSLVFSKFMSAPATAPPASPQPDPDVQRFLNYGSVVITAPIIYLLARWSTMLPAIALGGGWAPRAAWQQTRGNGWRLVLVVFLIPWALSASIDWAYASTGSNALVALLAITRALFLALGVIALSLAYRELAMPAPPPTAPPA